MKMVFSGSQSPSWSPEVLLPEREGRPHVMLTFYDILNGGWDTAGRLETMTKGRKPKRRRK